MKFWPVIPYERLEPSLFHYPKVSEITNKPIDWRYGQPASGFGPVKIYGDNTIELKGLPMGKTPEYMQERLRRYFSKFGPVTLCRALNHPLDPYQCEGTAYLTFREYSSCEAASKSVIRLGEREMGYKILSVRVMKTDEVTDGKAELLRKRQEIEDIVSFTRDLYKRLIAGDSSALANSPSISGYFGDRDKYFDRVKTFFIFNSETSEIVPRRLIDLEKELTEFQQSLDRELEASLAVHWRVNAPIKELPEYTKRQIRLWDKKDPLPFDLQIQSRDMRQHRVFDEKFLVESRKKRERAWNRAASRRAGIAKRKGEEMTQLPSE
jgi:hypothetical protein